MSDVILQKVESQSSIEIVKNTKGFTYSVKAYGSSEVEISVKLKNLTKAATDLIKELESANSPSF